MNSNKQSVSHVDIDVAVLSNTLIVFSNAQIFWQNFSCQKLLGQFLTFLNGKLCPNHPELTLAQKKIKIYL